jgi:hypothetical protein
VRRKGGNSPATERLSSSNVSQGRRRERQEQGAPGGGAAFAEQVRCRGRIDAGTSRVDLRRTARTLRPRRAAARAAILPCHGRGSGTTAGRHATPACRRCSAPVIRRRLRRLGGKPEMGSIGPKRASGVACAVSVDDAAPMARAAGNARPVSAGTAPRALARRGRTVTGRRQQERGCMAGARDGRCWTAGSSPGHSVTRLIR